MTKRIGWLVAIAVAAFCQAATAAETAAMKVGIIGLDAHAVPWTKLLTDPKAEPPLTELRVVAAYPSYSKDIPFSAENIEKNIAAMKAMNVEIVDSIAALLQRVDYVLILGIDGRPHLEQARQVIAARKPLFVDKPVASNMTEIVKLFELARREKVPCFSNSSLRYGAAIAGIPKDPKLGRIIGCSAYSNNTSILPDHPDLYYYGIHGCEVLFTIMGPGVESVRRVHTPTADLAIGVWKDGRLGTFRGILEGRVGFGATAFAEKGIVVADKFEGYGPLLVEIAKFFRTGKPPFTAEETLEIYAFMEAADQSKRQGGAAVSVAEVLKKAQQAAAE